jgi:mycothiol system anti-sigma-R factor
MASEEPADCEETIERLYHYLDGELTDERRADIAQHLDDCSPCLGAYGFEAELRRVIAQKCRDHVPESLFARVRAALDEEERAAGGSH